MQKYHIMVHHSLFLKMNYKNTLMLYYFLNIMFSSAIYVIGEMDDMSTSMVHQTISKNEFYQIKKYTHCADSNNLDKS